MIYELIRKDENEFNKKNPINFTWGKLPFGERQKISKGKAWAIFEEYSPSAITYNQIYDQKDLEYLKDLEKSERTIMHSAHIYYLNDFYVVFFDRYNYALKIGECLHDWKEISYTPTGDHTIQCQKCQKITHFDSSG